MLMSCSSFLSVSNGSRLDHEISIFGSHATHNTSIRNGGRCLAYNVSKYGQNRFRFNEIMAAEIRVPTPKHKYWILLS